MAAKKSNIARRIAKGVADAVKAGFADGGVIAPAPNLAPPEIKIMKPIRREVSRVICGMGSGGPEDINTYARVDAMSKEDRAAMRDRYDRHNFKPIMSDDAVKPQEPEIDPSDPMISAGSIADVMDRAYHRDPKTMKLVLRDDLPTEAEVDATLEKAGK
jgi:hypothetical protein